MRFQLVPVGGSIASHHLTTPSRPRTHPTKTRPETSHLPCRLASDELLGVLIDPPAVGLEADIFWYAVVEAADAPVEIRHPG